MHVLDSWYQADALTGAFQFDLMVSIPKIGGIGRT
jgi:hypothetical protein